MRARGLFPSFLRDRRKRYGVWCCEEQRETEQSVSGNHLRFRALEYRGHEFGLAQSAALLVGRWRIVNRATALSEVHLVEQTATRDKFGAAGCPAGLPQLAGGWTRPMVA
jgi:hypothetical protein